MTMFSNLKNLIRNQKNHKHGDHHQESKEPSHLEPKRSRKSDVCSAPESKDDLPFFNELSHRYQILEKIGEGAFSKVYKAVDHDLNIEVAIKVIEKESMSASQLQAVSKEISIMRRLDHPNIAKLYNYINAAKRAFIVIEYISGGELFNQIVKYTYFSEDLSRHILIQVVKAVDYLHSEVGVVHRDIKPENLLFEKIDFFPNEEGHAKRRVSDDENKLDEGEFRQNVGGGMVGRVTLADFGLSKVLWDSNTKTPCGTASYTAPEVVKDEAYSKSVDMWAVGCVLYTLLCGFPPFYDTDPKTLTLKVSKGEYTFLSPWWDEISKEAKDLVSHLLTVDPEQRYSPDEVLNHPWTLNNSKPTKPASDAPLYRTKNESVLRFEDTIPTVQHLTYLSPRAEAMKFAFDTGMNIQRTGTPLRRLLDEDDYFDESDDEDSNDSEDDADDNAGIDASDSDSLHGNTTEDSCFRHQPMVTTSPIIKKFNHYKINDPLSTPNHCSRRKDSWSDLSSKIRNRSLSPTSVNGSRASLIATPKAMKVPSLAPNQYRFKEIDDFNLKFDGNTLLNRRKVTGSLACGPAV